MLIDPYGRKLTYLRVSVTDRCNLRCSYCLPERGIETLPRTEILSYEEILRIVRIAVSMGLVKIRITGGEPLLRQDIEQLLASMGQVDGIEDFALSTNGTCLQGKAEMLLGAGVQRININLHTLRPERFAKICQSEDHARVIAGIEKVLSMPFKMIKLNTVIIRGFNDDEIPDLAKLTLDQPIDVRFIEPMPIGNTGFWTSEKVLSKWEVLDRVRQVGPVESIASPDQGCEGPAERCRIKGAKGEIGVIAPISSSGFCEGCNRLRLTPDGMLRACLMTGPEIDLKTPLRGGCSDDEVRQLFTLVASRKPRSHGLDNANPEEMHQRWMCQIGG